ncbi:MAG: GGDEF domain-containing protein [Deltaproteobacteria bacterium]|nr:GGDEF domain-containing protein [Deltaproteobacteria bacterium]
MMGNLNGVDGDALRECQLLRYVDFDSVRGLMDTCAEVSLQPGDILLTPGEINSTLFILVSGRLRVHLNALEDDPIMIEAGESVGEMSVIDHQPVSAYVVADETCSLLAMNEETLWSLVRSSHAAACNLLFMLTRRLRRTDTMVVEDNLALEDVYENFCSIDALTGLHNRFWIDNMLNRLVNRSLHKGTPISIIMIDIDDFTNFNDLYGPAHGDRILYYMAHTFTENLRPTEVIARYGDDEFVVILPDLDLQLTRGVAERLLNAVIEAVPVTPDGQSYPHPTVSMGIAQMQPDQTIEDFISLTEEALARARGVEGNSISE